MSIKVAIATSDKTNIDLHFGQASQFQIYELHGDHFEFLETRETPKTTIEQTSEENSTSENFAGGCGNGFGGGCGSGCGGGCGGGAGGPISPAVKNLLDCRAVVAAQIGQNVRRQFERNAVSVFDIELTIEEALKKLAAYYLKFEE